MTRNRFNQAKHQSTSTNNLTLGKARRLFLEDNDNIYMKDTYKIANIHTPTDEKDVVNKEFCNSNLSSSNKKIDILNKNTTELRKVDFDKFNIETLQLNKIQVNEELINEFFTSTNEVTNTVNCCNKVASDTISKYNQLKQEFDNNKFNQNITHIHLVDMFTTGLSEYEEVIKKTNSAVDEALIKKKRQ